MSASCPHCGFTLPTHTSPDAQALILDLQKQVQHLTAKASSALNQLAAYEDEIHQLRAQCARLQKEREQWTAATTSPPPPTVADPSRLSPPRPSTLEVPLRPQSVLRLSSLASMIPGRRRIGSKDVDRLDSALPPLPPLPLGFGMNTNNRNASTPNLVSPPVSEYLTSPSPPLFATDSGPKPHSLTLVGLQSSLETERNLRRKAESNLTQAQTELEELTAQLFGQANEMVAAERKARAKLEERVKLLENRDGEKRRRLDRLENAVARIERVRAMVTEPAPPYTDEKENLLVARNIVVNVG